MAEINQGNKRIALDSLRNLPGRASRGTGDQIARSNAIGFSYLRVSTKEQARTGGGTEGYSIPAQRVACQTKAEQMGVIIQHEHEYVDAGESARSADREELQRILRDIKTIRPDYVFVHKIDRLARNREDDIAINLLLRKHGVRLISCTENIDDTPSGRLLYGLMAEIAQFYSGNLAQEVLKGLKRKAEEGGTPFRAPLGYVNLRESRGGIDYSWVELDSERAEIIRWCFEQYATGDWSAIDLTLTARDKGLTSRPTPKRPARPLSLTTMYHMLQNPYYVGVVSYQGIHYEGKHPVLVEPDTWLAVQDVLIAHNHTGEKDRTHNHYLRSTIYCSACGGRLVYSRNTGNGGTYEYFLCVKKKTRSNNCTRPAIRLERIEDGIAQFYGRFHVQPKHADKIRAGVHAELAAQRAETQRSAERARKRRAQVEDERYKLLQAHYAGAIPQDLLASEMQRLTRALAETDAAIRASKATTEDVESTLAEALLAASHCERAYLTAPNTIRRQINQGFFRKLFIGEDGTVVRAEMTEPFAILLDASAATAQATPQPDAAPAPQTAPDATTARNRTRPSSVVRATYGDNEAMTQSTQNTTPGKNDLAGRGVKDGYLVGAAGFEPATPSL
jgi:site-specific DNA recombinase